MKIEKILLFILPLILLSLQITSNPSVQLALISDISQESTINLENEPEKLSINSEANWGDIPISTYTGNSSITVDRNGELFVVHEYYISTTYYLEVLNSSDGGKTWSSYNILTDVAWIGNPDIATNLYTNEIYVAYEREYSSSDHDIYVWNPTSGGTRHVDTSGGNSQNPSIAIDIGLVVSPDNATIFVSYEHLTNYDEREIHVDISTDQGISFSPWHKRGYIWVQLIDIDTNVYTQADIAIDANGIVYLTYAFGSNYATISDIYVEYGPGSSTSASFENQIMVWNGTYVGLGPGSHPSIAVTRDSTAVNTTIAVSHMVYWVTPGTYDVYIEYSYDGGGYFSIDYITNTPSTSEWFPIITTDGMDTLNDVSGNFSIVYTVGSSGFYVVKKAPSSAIFNNFSPVQTGLSDVAHWSSFGITTTRVGFWSQNWYPVITYSSVAPDFDLFFAGDILNAVNLISPFDTSIINDNTPLLEWDPLIGAKEYQIQIDTLESDLLLGNPSDFSISTINPNYIISILSDDTYYWRVRGNDSVGNLSPWSTIWSFTVNTTEPMKPTLLLPNNLTYFKNHWVNLTWNSVPDAIEYQVQVGLNAFFATPLENITTVNTAYDTMTFLADGTYLWHVRAKNLYNTWGPWSESRMFFIDSTIPDQPLLTTPLDGSTLTDNWIEFKWNAGVTGLEYQIQIDASSVFSSPLVNSSTSNLYYVITTLSNGTFYWRIRAYNSAGKVSPWSEVWSFTLNTSSSLSSTQTTTSPSSTPTTTSPSSTPTTTSPSSTDPISTSSITTAHGWIISAPFLLLMMMIVGYRKKRR